MKKRALRKEFFMEIRKSLPRFLSILFIVALGTAFYSGIQSSSPDMRYSGDAYFDVKDTGLHAFYSDSTPFLTYFYPSYIGIVDVNLLCSL